MEKTEENGEIDCVRKRERGKREKEKRTNNVHVRLKGGAKRGGVREEEEVAPNGLNWNFGSVVVYATNRGRERANTC